MEITSTIIRILDIASQAKARCAKHNRAAFADFEEIEEIAVGFLKSHEERRPQ